MSFIPASVWTESDNIGNFAAGEVILLGGNLPHMWQCNEEYYQNHPTRKVEAIVIQFLPDCMGRDFMNLPEMYLLPKLFENARKGMKFIGRTRARIVELMYRATQATEMERLIILLSIFKTMAETDEYLRSLRPMRSINQTRWTPCASIKCVPIR